MQNRDISFLLFVDLEKAFDKVNIKNLLEKVKKNTKKSTK